MDQPLKTPLEPEIAHLLVATADHGDAALDANVQKVLAILRKQMGMDVVFVSKFEDGRRVFKQVAAPRGFGWLLKGHSDPLEDSWCWHIVHGRMQQFIRDGRPLVAAGEAPKQVIPIGTHLSAPVVLKDGRVFGTVCAFAHRVNEGASLRDVWRLRAVAELIAKRIEPDDARPAVSGCARPGTLPSHAA